MLSDNPSCQVRGKPLNGNCTCSKLGENKILTRVSLIILLGLTLTGCDRGTEVSGEVVENKLLSDISNKPNASSPFIDITNQSGVAFIHQNGGKGRFYMPEIMGAGAAVLDIDNDGDLDLYLVQGGKIGTQGEALTDQIYRNDLINDQSQGTTLAFTNITGSAGLPNGDYGMGVTTGDIDGDGLTDLYVTNLGPNRLLKNLGDGSFADITQKSGTANERWSVPATFFDMDGDNDLDLYSGSYVDFRIANHRDCFSSTGLADYCSPHSYNAVADSLYRNNGDGTFENISASSGIRANKSKALGVISGDFNNDGLADLYVANDGVANQLWLNRGNGKFEDDALFAGAALNYEGMPEASMGVDAADVDGDGDEDLFMTHLRGETNTLYLNHGDGSFEDKTIRMGLAGPSIPYTGFGTAWFDVENDGKLDLLTVNGAVTVEERLVQTDDPFPYHQPNQLYKNNSSGAQLRFDDYPMGEDNPLGKSFVSRGAVLGDLDNDGDLDVVITNNSGPTRILLNNVGQNNSWLGVRALNSENGADSLGAMVHLLNKGDSVAVRRVRTSGSYVSAHDPRIIFGLGEPINSNQQQESAHLRVKWPNGTQEDFGPFKINNYHTIVMGAGHAVDANP